MVGKGRSAFLSRKNKKREAIMLDNFREWLSDNLRYILLILAIFIALALVFFGVRAITGALSSRDGQNTGSESTTVTTEEGEASADAEQTDPAAAIEAEEATPEPTAEPAKNIIGGELKDDIYPDVAKVITAYYEAMQNRDVDGVRAVTDVLPDEAAQKVSESSTIYSDLKIYTKEGPEGDDSSFVVYVSYKYQKDGQLTMFPGIERMLVRKDDSGQYKIVFSEYDKETSDYIDSLAESDDIKELTARIQNEYDTAKAVEEAAQAANEDSQQTAEDGTAVPAATEDDVTQRSATIRADVNLREGAGTEYPSIAVLKAGEPVTIIGEKYGDWYYVVSSHGDGYVNAGYIADEAPSASGEAIAPEASQESSGTATSEEQNPTPAPTAAPAQSYPDTWSDTVNAAGVNLRAAEGMDAAIIGVLTKGETVTVTGTAHNGWYHVVASSLGEGYCGARYVGPRAEESTGSDTWTDTINAGVRLRAGESMDAAIIGVLNAGETVTIQGSAHNGWYHVVSSRLGAGYVGARFVGNASSSSDSQSAPAASTNTAPSNAPVAAADSTAPVYGGEWSGTCNSGCNLREGPGASYNIVGVVEAGAHVAVLGTSSNGNWYRIRTSVGEGYVNVGFIS